MLENLYLFQMHVARTIAMLKQPQCAFLSGWPVQRKRRFGKVIRECIMGTDVAAACNSRHALEEVVAQITASRAVQSTAQEPEGVQPGADGGGELRLLPDDRVILVKGLVHAADMSNPTKDWEQAQVWALRWIEERKVVAVEEKEMDMDPSVSNIDDIPATQTFFIEVLVQPMFAVLEPIVEVGKVITSGLEANKARWEAKALLSKKATKGKGKGVVSEGAVSE